MARIPEDELTRLKQDVALARLAAARGIALKPSGKNLLGLCPFHDDHEPSLSIDPVQNLWHCFGCQQGGGVIDWVMQAEGVSFRHAVELLREQVVSSQFSVFPPAPNGRGCRSCRPCSRPVRTIRNSCSRCSRTISRISPRRPMPWRIWQSVACNRRR